MPKKPIRKKFISPTQMRREVDTVKEVFARKSERFIEAQMEIAISKYKRSKLTPLRIIDEFQLALDTHLIDSMPINEKSKTLAKEVIAHNAKHLGHTKEKSNVFTQEDAILVLEKGIQYMDALNTEKLSELKFDAAGFRELMKAHLRTVKGNGKPFLNMNKKVIEALIRINAAFLRQTLGERMSTVLRELSLSTIERFRLCLNEEITN